MKRSKIKYYCLVYSASFIFLVVFVGPFLWLVSLSFQLERQIFQVPPVYPRRALERGIEGCVMLKFTVTKVGSTRDPSVEWAVPPGIFDRAAMRSALKYKYKPQIRDGEAIEVPNVRTVVIFKIEDAGKSMDYVPEGCA